MELLEGIQVIHHSAIRMEKGEKVIYFDPYELKEASQDADMIFITHDHYDHFSPKDIKKVMKEDTILIVVDDLKEIAMQIQKEENKVIGVKPNETYHFDDISFTTTVAYNQEKLFHPKEKNWVGYIVTVDDMDIYVAGDTDNLIELQEIQCDIALVPIGGMYTMNYKEAADLVNHIEPQIVIPTHYGMIVGSKEDADAFEKLVKEKIKVMIQ